MAGKHSISIEPSKPSMVTKAMSSPDFLVVIRLTVPTMPTMVVTVPSGSSPQLGDQVAGRPPHVVPDVLEGMRAHVESQRLLLQRQQLFLGEVVAGYLHGR